MNTTKNTLLTKHTLEKSRQKILASIENLKEEQALFRESIKNNFPHATLLGKNYFYTRSSWCYSTPKQGQLNPTQFCDQNNELYLQYFDIVSGNEMFEILKEAQAKIDESLHKNNNTYLLLGLIEEDRAYTNKINPLSTPNLYEMLFVEID